MKKYFVITGLIIVLFDQANLFCWPDCYYLNVNSHNEVTNNIQFNNITTGREISLSYSQFLTSNFTFLELSLTYTLTDNISKINITRDEFNFNNLRKKILIDRNIFRVERRNKLSSYGGHNFVFFETFSINSGKFSKKRPDNTATGGYELRMKGLFMLLDDCSENSAIKFISDHFDIRLFKSEYSVNHFSELETKGIIFVLNGINF